MGYDNQGLDYVRWLVMWNSYWKEMFCIWFIYRYSLSPPLKTYLDHYSLCPNLAPSLFHFQTVLWLSYFFSPVMTLVAVIVFFLFFYIYLFRLRVSMVILRDSFDFCIILFRFIPRNLIHSPLDLADISEKHKYLFWKQRPNVWSLSIGQFKATRRNGFQSSRS